MDVRAQIALHIGNLTLASFEQIATVKAHEKTIAHLKAENERLKHDLGTDAEPPPEDGKQAGLEHLHKANGHAPVEAPPDDGLVTLT